MKRSSWLFFALMLIFNLFASIPAQAVITISNVAISFGNDADGNGIFNRGDTMTITCVAFFAAPTAAWTLQPTADLTSLGMGFVNMTAAGNLWTANVNLNNFNQSIQYGQYNINVSAQGDDTAMLTAPSNPDPFVDLCQVEGSNASVTPTTAKAGDVITITIVDNRYQAAPLGGTICTVNLGINDPILGNLMGNTTTPMNPIGLPAAPRTFRTTYTIPQGAFWNGPLTISLTDPMLGHPTVNYQTNSILVDGVGSVIDNTNTTVVIQSGNATALPGDVLRLTAAVTLYDGENVTASCSALTSAAATPELNPPHAMPLITSNGIGNPATWQLDVVLRDADVKTGSLPITFTFTDNDGNVTNVTRYIAIDLDAPNILNPTANIWSDGIDSALDTATMGCRLEFTAELSSDIEPDTLTATIDLSEIGASAQYPMSRVGTSDTFRANYIVPQGNLEDIIDYEFVISVRDTAGNLVAQSAAPPIRIDNKPPTISNIQLTSSNPNNSSILRVGDEFTVECTITDIESGSASVDLTRIGVPLPHTLLPVGSNVYRGTWTLPNASESTAVPAKVDGFTAFTVYANDTVNGGANIGHIIPGYTNQLMIDNEPPEIIETAFRSDALDTLPPATVLIIGNSAKFYARVIKAPITVTINMLQLNQGNAENMWASTNSDYPSGDDWYEYVLPGEIPEGLFDDAIKTFRVTATDDAGNTYTADITTPVGIDNKPIKVTDFDVNVTYRNDPPDDTDISIVNLNKAIEFTISLDSTTAVADLASATIDLSKFGGKTSTELLTYIVANHAYSLTTNDYTELNYDSSSHRFTVTITDKSGNITTAQSAQRRVDNWPPVISLAKASLPNGGIRAKIGDTILFETEVSRNEGVAPVINLASLGLSSAQAMTLVSTTSGVSLFQHSAVIANGTTNDATSSWTITSRDNDLNFVASITNTLRVDSQPPQISIDLNLSGMNDPSYIRLGESITFTVELDPADTTINTVTVDMRAIGLGASETLTIIGSTAARTETTLLTTSEYTNHRFTATISDVAGNKVTSQSQTFTEVDCRPVILNNSGMVLWQDNGVVNSGFAGPGDVIKIYASATYYQDAVVTANLATGTPVADYASATMTFNSANNRHEGLITIATDTAGWPIIAGNLIYRVRAVDNVNNISSTTYAPCPDFFVRNTLPTALTAGINLSPNYYLATTSSNILVYNLASSTTGDGLIASATFANNLIVHKAWLDFREFGTGTIDLKTDNSSSAVTVSGYSVNRLPAIEDGVSRRVWLYAMDEAGNATSTSERMFIDNVAPTLVSAEFDGNILSVSLSENFDNNAFVVENWQIVGSSTLGSPENLTFNATAPIATLDWSSLQLALDISHLRTMSEWASTPIYLKVTHDNATSAVTDMWGNELRPVEHFPITITSSAWREPARITHFTMNQIWPAEITLDLLFSKAMDESSLIATAGVLLLATDTTGTFENNVDYNTGYVFQASSTNPLASDTFTWQSDTHLRITLSETGRRWIARKLTNDTNVKLYFACRHSARPFVLDFLGKPVTHIAASSPLVAADNRPVSGFAFRGPPNAPKLNIGNRTLVLSSTDQLLLFAGTYNANDEVPYLVEPEPNNTSRVTGFHSKITLYESNSNSSATLQLTELATTSNPIFASSTVTLNLTDTDLVNILSLYQANPSPIWELSVKAGAFTNLWGTPNLAYLPSDYPGSMAVATGTPATPAAIAAVSMSDKPTVSQKLAGELIFEIEVFPPDLDGIPLPLQWQTTPKTAIFRQDTGEWVASGTFVSYSERTIANKLRGVFRYKNTTALLPTTLQDIPAQINVYGVTDIFGNTYNFVSSYAYDLNTKNDAATEGFTDISSAAIVLDTRLPQVSSIIPNDYIGKIPAGSIFRVNFDEVMNTAITPTLTLATTTQSMSFSFSAWTATATAEFSSNTEFTAALPNGIWYYQVSGGTDFAGNVMQTTNTASFPVQVRTYAPEIDPAKTVLRTVQNTISNTQLINQPWSRYVGSAVFSVEYTSAPTVNFPHFLEIYDPVSNALQARVMLSIVGNLATATVAAPSAGAIGPTNFATRVVDSLNNRTANILTIVYDGLAPSLTDFAISGSVGSSTAEYTYFNPLSGDLVLNLVATTTDALRLAVYTAGGATSTQNINDSGTPGQYFLATGSNYANGTYTFTIVDMAGNIGTGSATRTIIADSVAPSVISILPADAIGNSPAGLTEIAVNFSEQMDVSASPTLGIATSTKTISMNCVRWENSGTRAVFTNTFDIDSTYPAGSYPYNISGGKDLAGNAQIATAGTIMVYSDGPFARIDNLTDQSHVYGIANGIKTNYAFNPAYGPATLQINYVVGPFDAPHSLQVYSSTGAQVGTSTSSFTGNIDIPFPDNFMLPTYPPAGNLETYKFKLIDANGIVSGNFLPVNLSYDIATPTLNSISLNLPSTATTTGGLTWYYSPDTTSTGLTLSTVTMTTQASDSMRMLIYKEDASIATSSSDMISSANGITHTSSIANLAVGEYILTGVDFAGNLVSAASPASQAKLIVDSTAPSIISATPILAGALATGSGVFELTFSEPMNTAVTPALQIATDTMPVPISLQFTSWTSSTTCRFSNPQAIDKSITPGTYSYLISSAARDLAGNLSITPTPGSFTVELFTQAPTLAATPRIISRQLEIWGNKDLVDYPLSFETNSASPDIATLSIAYNGLYQTPHTLHVYRNNDNTEVASFAILPAGTTAITIDDNALGNPAGIPGGIMASYSFILSDNIGNIGASHSIPIRYDGIQPIIATTSINNVFIPPTEATLYYNGRLGPLNVSFTTAASTATDSLVLAIFGIASATVTPATYSYEMSPNLTTGVNTYSVASGTIPDGTYWITAADLAGNYANGVATITPLIVDTVAPGVLLATTTNNLGVSTSLPIVSSNAGTSYFKLQFDERMRTTASPTLTIATVTAEIGYTFVGWLTTVSASDTALFKNTATITNALPQGTYICKVTGMDLAGNSMSIITGTADVRSRGPIVSSFHTTSYQATTASATLASGLEMLTNQPFSFDIAPGIATMSIRLAQIPDGNPGNLWLHFMLDNTTAASYPVALVGLNATFSWSIANGPNPSLATTYTIRVADANDDLSLESHPWRIDNASPAVQLLVASGGELATDSVYFSPSLHRYITTRFNTVESEAPKLRILGSNSTDTFDLTSTGTNQWSTNFEGRYSRGGSAMLPDGVYGLDMVDRAGNVAFLTSDGLPINFDVIIDTVAPVIATYTLTQNNLAVTSFAPAAGDLEVIVVPVDPGETASETGIWWLEVRDNSGIRVNRQRVENIGGFFTAVWDGTDASGNMVLDGTYKLRATDYAGNQATLETEIFARTTPFRISAIEQVSSCSARLWFNHDVDENSWVGATDAIIASPPLTITDLTRDQERSITFNVSPAFEHGISYIFTVATGTIKSVFGASISETANTIILPADGRGPVIDSVSFDGLAGQQEFRVQFDENYTAASAGNKSNYTLVSTSGPVTIANAVTQSDLRSVILTANPALVENASYTITSNNIVDGYGNATSSSYAFKGRDLTPPTLTVSAFSNPANENDIIAVVISNEPLKTAPTLTVAQSNAPIVTSMMQQGVEPQAYMMGVSLSSSYAGNGTLAAEAKDIAGNTGYGTTTFTVAYVSSARASLIQSADSIMTLSFNEQSLKSDATVHILQHQLEKGDATGGAIRTSLQRQFRATIGSLRGSLATDTVLPNHSELVPVSDAYEIGINKEKVNKGFSVNLASSEATSTVGLGLFYQSGDSWKFVTASRDKEGAFVARTGSSQMFAIMRDIAAPRINLAEDMTLSEPFRTARPEFKGKIEEAGSGVDTKSINAYIDGGPAQPVQVAANGEFVFTPLANLVAGDHDLTIKATDLTGNQGEMASIRFAIVQRLELGQIIQYPNPANRRAFIRISANRGDLTSDLVKVTIYDVAGHKVGNLYDVKAVRENWGINSRYLYDIPWDLCNSNGKSVANGVYFARIEVRDPDDTSVKTKKNFKLAVLR
ncbi:MAG: Ig-like domain-containing protein [Candidatus Riflebacteria bacterium]|nr:Ig-like domain-containing protein [Candidatus Riflebacteria bacterium]